MNDFHQLQLDTCKWTTVATDVKPGHRFCHSGAVEENGSLFIFGGYDSEHRLNDFWEFRFDASLKTSCKVPPSSIIEDLAVFVDNESLSDVSFSVEGKKVYAHKIFLLRCKYFSTMLEGGFKESIEHTQPENTITISGISHPIFIALLRYLYTDKVEIQLDMTMELFEAAEKFGVNRLKLICEQQMLSSITVENAASIFYAADQHSAMGLKDKCLTFILDNFEAVSKTSNFEKMARSNVELVLQVLKRR